MNTAAESEIYLLGVGHNTPVFIELVEACGYHVSGIYHCDDSKTGQLCSGIAIRGSHADFFANGGVKGKQVAFTMGNIRIRMSLSSMTREQGGRTPTLIHPAAIVSRFATLEEGVVVHALAAVQAGTCIGRDAVISVQSGVMHNCFIGRGCYISSQSIVGAYTKLGDRVHVGMGACLVTGKVKVVGDDAVIGGGSVVVSDVEAGAIVAGNPARVLRCKSA